MFADVTETEGLSTRRSNPFAVKIPRLDRLVAAFLARVGVIEESRLRSTFDLAWPRIVTGFAIMSKRTVDLAVVGVAIGPTAVAGLTLANAYWMAGKFAGIGLAGGAIALVSQNYGGEAVDRASLVVEQSLWLALALSLPVVAACAFFAEPLVALVGSNPDAIGYGAAYLAVVAPGLFFEYLNLLASRTYAGVSDTVTPMTIRAGGALLNVLLSVGLVFGAGWGVVGAAVGTTVSTGIVTLVFAWGMTGHTYFGRGASPVPLQFSGPHFDLNLMKQLVTVSAPLVGRRVAEGVVVFPLLAIAATFGPVAVAAVGVGRQVRALLNSFSWGFSIAASTLVGQRLGADDEPGAEAYGREITQLSLVVFVTVGLLTVALADPIARVFVDDPTDVELSAAFVRVAAVSVLPLGVNASITGTLRGAGDTQVPFVSSLVGLYVVALPTAWLGTVTALGVTALQLSLLVETLVPLVVNARRFRSDAWKAVSRSYRPSAGD
jgi:putative MATE family efflux protein